MRALETAIGRAESDLSRSELTGVTFPLLPGDPRGAAPVDPAPERPAAPLRLRMAACAPVVTKHRCHRIRRSCRCDFAAALQQIEEAPHKILAAVLRGGTFDFSEEGLRSRDLTGSLARHTW
jgi:hypothetical protein